MGGMRFYIMLPVIVLLLRCTAQETTGPGGEGNGSETVARGVIVDSTGTPADNVPVQLLPVAYNPVMHDTLPDQWQVLTDAQGEYRLEGISAGTFTIEAVSAGLKALVRGIEANGERVEVVVDTCRLRKTGTIFVRLTGTTSGEGDYVYAPGTSVFTVITTRDSIAGQTVLSGVPAGIYTDLLYVEATDSLSTDLLGDTVTVQPGDTVASAYAAWKYSRRLYFNTTVSGADVPSNVYDFPLLVRLSDAAFDFSQAQNGGEDIRFTKSNDGLPLVYEIERWDSANGMAELWVKVDTVFGNDSTQSIIMYWGNPAAIDMSNGAAVFDTATGFQGVWHLAEAGNTMVKDATINRYDGTPTGMTSNSAVNGNIGGAQALDGSTSFFTMANTAAGTLNFPVSGPYTVSAWVYIDTIDTIYHTIVSKGNQQYNLGIMASEWGFSVCPAGGGWDVSTSPATSKAWVHLVGIRNGTRQHLYVNGYCVDSTIVNSYPEFTREIGYDLVIGSIPDDSFYFFNGIIDEVCISGVERDPAWIKLSYMNQKANDLLITFRQIDANNQNIDGVFEK
ncbi:MAG: DUF2341 domain-containing protein [Chitinispirillaceae bacterium]|nr:DUF2341 domain-containing protein [Chitinispirillaceae bacterium]